MSPQDAGEHPRQVARQMVGDTSSRVPSIPESEDPVKRAVKVALIALEGLRREHPAASQVTEAHRVVAALRADGLLSSPDKPEGQPSPVGESRAKPSEGGSELGSGQRSVWLDDEEIRTILGYGEAPIGRINEKLRDALRVADCEGRS